MDLIELSEIAKAQSKRRKKNGKPVGTGNFARVQSDAARGIESKPFTSTPPAPVAVEAAAERGRLMRVIRPGHIAAAAAVPVAAASIYGIARARKRQKDSYGSRVMQNSAPR